MMFIIAATNGAGCAELFYSRFEYRDLHLEGPRAIAPNGLVRAAVTVTNAGQPAGDEDQDMKQVVEPGEFELWIGEEPVAVDRSAVAAATP